MYTPETEIMGERTPRQTTQSVAEALKSSTWHGRRVKINFANERELSTVPGIGPKSATKIVKVRALVGNITPEVLMSCLGGRADRNMQQCLDFAPNCDQMDSDLVEEEPSDSEAHDETGHMRAVLTKMMSEMMKKEFVTPAGQPKSREPRKLWVDEEEEDNLGVVRRGTKKGPRGLPKNLQYDGKSNWAAFKQKFERYAEAYEWTEEECLNCLCWSLVGKAADFYATVTERMEDLSFRVLLKKLEKRFGARELAETVQAQFQQAIQTEGESLEDWADRVLTLATRAFKELPEKYANQQAVARFCQGLHDKAAAQDACVQRLRTMEEAMDHVKWFQHVHQVVYGRPKVSRRTRDHDDEAAVCEMRADSREKEEKAVTATEVERMMEKLSRELLQKLSMGSESKDNKRFKDSDGSCYNCGKKGHLKRKCPELKCFNCQGKGHLKRDCPEAARGLNGSGSGKRPEPRPVH